MKKILELHNIKLGYGNEETLRIDYLSIVENSITGLLGPSGGGKSSLFNAITQENLSLSYWQEGNLVFEGSELDKKPADRSIAQVSQKARLYTDTVIANFLDGLKFKAAMTADAQYKFTLKVFKTLGILDIFKDILDDLVIKQSMGIHKMLLIAKAMVKKPKLLLLDEVLSNTSIKDEEIIIKLIKQLKKFTTVFIITHNKDEAKNICDSIALVSGGVLHEHTEAQLFFAQPQSEIGIEFLKSGSAWYVNPNNEYKKEDDLTALRRFSSMCEFYWIQPNKLGGMQKPGLMTEIDEDLSIMKRLGVNVLVTLQQTPIDTNLLNQYDIKGLHFPIVDMGIPGLQETHGFIKHIQSYFNAGQNVIYHCKAGMGRTGIMLACNLLYLENISAIKAIEKVRYTNHKYIQTNEQLAFVGAFEKHLKDSDNF